MSIPIVGWIAAAIAALIAIGVYFWNTSAKFRAVLKGTWAAFKAMFTGIGQLAKQVFGAIGDLIKAAFSLDAAGIGTALNKLKAGFSDYGKQIGQAFNEAYDAEMTEAAKKEAAEKSKGKSNKTTSTATPAVATPTVATPTVDPTGGSLSTVGGGGGGSSSGDGGKIKNITISIEKLIENFTIHTATMGESMDQMKAAVLDTLMGALNDTQLATN